MLSLLIEKKRKIEEKGEILMEFLSETRKQKQAELNRISKELTMLERDIESIASGREKRISFSVPEATRESIESSRTDNIIYSSCLKMSNRITTHLDDLQSSYFESRSNNSLEDFEKRIKRFLKYSAIKAVSDIRYGDLFNTSNIISSMEFDRDDEYFATAGVTRKLKIYEMKSVMNELIEMPYPVVEMTNKSKISCLSWSSHVKSHIVSSDYEGILAFWDATSGSCIGSYEEHERRAWSVDFSPTDPMRFASGSDDCKVKVWSINQPNSIMTMESKANICSVKFNPENSNFLAFGSADHHVYYYDVRSIKEPYLQLKGHKKAVSYVRFLSNNELVSASTDSSLKSWEISTGLCSRTFNGHANEKNFVGLSCNDDYIACGSENNSVFLYYKHVSKPILSYKFPTSCPITVNEF